MRRFVLEVDVAEPDQYLTVMARRAHEALGHRMAVSKVEDTEGAGDGWRWRMVDAEAAVSREAEGAGLGDRQLWELAAETSCRCTFLTWDNLPENDEKRSLRDSRLHSGNQETEAIFAAFKRVLDEAHVAAATGAASGEAACQHKWMCDDSGGPPYCVMCLCDKPGEPDLRELLAEWERSANPDGDGNQALHALLFALVERVER